MTPLIARMILIGIYIISVIRVYRWTRKAYSIGGRFQVSEISADTLYLTFFPLVNTIALFKSPLAEPKKFNYNRFFRIKK
jgi:hypothetical protein